ncbi:MAG: hypothetical protein GXO76_09985 [Calditrichaeota bacterium]|nr:hypothetical protein [Calditrichota bacterium]
MMKKTILHGTFISLFFLFIFVGCAGTRKNAPSREAAIQKKEQSKVLRYLKNNPNDPLAYFQLAKLSYQGNNYSQALVYLDSTLSKNPDYQPAYLLKGKTLCQLEEYKQACSAFVRLLEQDSEGLYVREVGGTVGILYKISQLTKGDFNDASPHFMPDGSQILFQSDRKGNWDIFSMNPMGGNILGVVVDSMNQEFPVPAPAGDWVYYTQNQGAETKFRDIYRVQPSSGKREKVVSGLSDDWYPAPDANQVFFVSNRLFPERDSLTSIFKQTLSKDEPPVSLFPNGIYAAPSVNEKTGKLLFTKKENGYFHLFEADFSGKHMKALGEEPFNYGNPCFSPDGKRVVFFSNQHKNYDIYLKDLQTGNVLRLTHFKGYDMNPVFSPDGSKIVFHSNRDGHFHIYEINLNLPVSRGELLDQLRRLAITLE